MDHMTAQLKEFAEAIIEDGIVDAEETTKIRERIYADGVIDREEADFLFQINDAVSGHDNDPAWQQLFVEALTAHVLEDEESPGEIDGDEAKWLISKIEGDGQVDDNEKALLKNIQAKASVVSESLSAFITAHA